MADTAMFSKLDTPLLKNTEGAIMMQLLLQTMTNSDALNEFLEPILNKAKERMQ